MEFKSIEFISIKFRSLMYEAQNPLNNHSKKI